LFTNPANEFINVEVNGIPGIIKIELTSVEGKIISTQFYPDGLNLKNRLDLKELKAGWYALRIQSERNNKTSKLLIIR